MVSKNESFSGDGVVSAQAEAASAIEFDGGDSTHTVNHSSMRCHMSQQEKKREEEEEEESKR